MILLPEQSQNTIGTLITDVVIPETINGVAVTSIGERAFFQNTTVEKVTIPDSVESIGASAFMTCFALSSVTIPSNVTSIGEYAFGFYSMSTEMGFPEAALTDVTVSWDNPAAVQVVWQYDIDYTAFDETDVTDVVLHVPAGTKSLYEAHDVWKQFKISEESVPEGVSVTLTPSAEEIYAGETVDITSSLRELRTRPR